MIRVILSAFLVVSTLALESDWNQATRDQILDIHNDYRRNEGGCQINKLEYDMDLERQAKSWAENCVFEHEMIDGRGENLAWDSNHNPEDSMIDYAAQRWFDEKKLYRWGQKDCEPSCHYTQLVWDSTSKVGCWSTRCPNLVHAYRDAWYLVCFYTPMGNWIGETPYEKQCDTPCHKGQTEEDSLCVGEAEEEPLPCEDARPDCPRYAEAGHCESNADWMMANCVLSCTDCGGPKAAPECKDENKDCEHWAGRGECTNNAAYMLKKCKKACNEC